MDREKVINGLKTCAGTNNEDGDDCVLDCPYKGSLCIDRLMYDALALLKEQETEDTGRCRIFQCKKCGFGIDDIFVTDEKKYQIVPRYCPNCGRSVKLG